MVKNQRHYLLPKLEHAKHASTACGQRERKDMAWSRIWDFVDCHRCWYYMAEQIVRIEGICR